MEVISAAKTVPVQESRVRVIEFISVYSSPQIQAKPASKIFIGLGDEHFSNRVQVFLK
jgi:hypothetical protein